MKPPNVPNDSDPDDGGTGPHLSFTSGRFVFIGGLHRSGTTVLARLISQHSKVSAFSKTTAPQDEGQHLQRVYPPAAQYGGPGRFAFHEEAALTEETSLASPEHRQRLLDAWSPHWDLTRRLLLEKSPPNLIRFRFLQALFPSSCLIAIIRHPVAVAYATQKWSKTDIPSLLRHWVVAHDRFEWDRRFLSRLMVVRYEELVESPIAVLRGVDRHLDLQPEARNLAIHQGLDQQYLARWRQDRSDPHRGGPLGRVAEELDSGIRRWGYRLVD
jgi:hypothetical protein